MKLLSRLVLVVLLVGPMAMAPPSSAGSRGADATHLVFSTYLGDTTFDSLYDVAVAPDGTIVIAGAVEGATVVRLSADGSRILSKRTIAGCLPKSVAVGADGAIYIAGEARNGLETVRPIQASPKSEKQAFVAKLSPDASQLLFCTYLGGSSADGGGQDFANEVCVDDRGFVYVVGATQASNDDFPVANATQATYGGGFTDGFVSIVDPSTPRLLFSTYFGGAGDDELKSCAVDAQSRRLYVAGGTLPAEAALGVPDCTTAVQQVGEYQQGDTEERWSLPRTDSTCKLGKFFDTDLRLLVPRLRGSGGARLVMVDSDVAGHGSSPRLGGVDVRLWTYDADLELVTTAYFGGPENDYPKRIAVDNRGIVYLIGETEGAGLPTVGPFQAAFAGGLSDSFVAAFDSATLQPVFSSYIGGSGFDFPFGIAVDADGSVVLVGTTDSTDFPTTAGAVHTTIQGGSDGWVAKVAALGDIVPDFSVGVDPPAITAVKGQSGMLTVTIARTGGFDGRVTVTAPDTRSIKVKLKPGEGSTTSDGVMFTYKVKKKAVPGSYDLVFTTRDDQSRERTATATLTIQ